MCARKYHRKSKSGCTNCRQRRIKCDEAQGGCQNCQKRNYTCSLRQSDAAQALAVNGVQILRQQPFTLVQSPTDPHFTNVLLQQGILSRLPRSTRPHAVRLLHHFSNETVTTMGFGITPQQAWCTAIPDLALKHDFVIHGVLAIAALHLSTTQDSADAEEKYRNVAALELNLGLVRYITEVRKITSDNAEALFAFSTAISLFSTYQARNDCRNLVEPRQPDFGSPIPAQTTIAQAVRIVCRALRTLRGAQVILVPGWSKIQDGPLRCVVQRESWSTGISVAEAHLDEERRLRNLESMWSNPQRTYEDHFDTLRHTWQILRESFTIVWRLIDTAPSNHTSPGPTFDWTSIFHFPVQCSLAFASLLEQQCIEAWVLVAHYAILHAEVTGLWWLDGSAANLLATAALVIGTNNWEWITWPAARIGTDLESLRSLALVRPKICA